MPLLKDRLSITDTTIQNTAQDVTNILSVNEIINLNILGVIAPNFNVPSGSIFIAEQPFSTAPGVGLNKYGGGTLVLTKDNVIRSMTKIYEGKLSINSSKNVFNDGIMLLSDNSVILEIINNSISSFDSSISSFSNGGTSLCSIVCYPATPSVDLYIRYPIQIVGTLTIGDGQKVTTPEPSSILTGISVYGTLNFVDVDALPSPSETILYIITGLGKLQFSHISTAVTIASSNTYSGGTEIFFGVVTAGSSMCFGFGPIRLYSGATLDLNNQAINNTIYTEGGTILNDSNYTGQIYYI